MSRSYVSPRVDSSPRHATQCRCLVRASPPRRVAAHRVLFRRRPHVSAPRVGAMARSAPNDASAPRVGRTAVQAGRREYFRETVDRCDVSNGADRRRLHALAVTSLICGNLPARSR